MSYLCGVESAYNKGMDTSIINKVREFFRTKPIEKAWLFGSFSRGEEGPDSDVETADKDKILIYERAA